MQLLMGQQLGVWDPVQLPAAAAPSLLGVAAASLAVPQQAAAAAATLCTLAAVRASSQA
jgi:hypothetical protein